MNGFVDHGLDESAFGEKKGFSEGIRSFDAFRKIFPIPLRSYLINILDPQVMHLSTKMRKQACPLPKSTRLTSLFTSQNQTNLHPSKLHWWLHHPRPHHSLHSTLLHRAPPLVLRP